MAQGTLINQENLSNSDLRKKILILAIPAIGEMVLHMLVGVSDVAFVGRLGVNQLAAIGIATNVLFTLLFVFAAIGVGATAIVARHVGANENDKANFVTSQAFLLGIIMALIIGTLLYFNAESLMGFFAKEAEVIYFGTQYLEVTAFPSVLILIFFVLRGVVIGSGNTRLPLLLAFIATTMNVIGNYVLIFGKWGFPALGVAGAAWATSIALSFVSIILIAILFSGKIKVKIEIQHVKLPNIDTIKRILKVSIPAQIEELLRGGGNLLVTLLISINLGAIAYASHTVALTVESLSFMPGVGFAIATTSLVGQLLGAKKPAEAERVGWEAFKMAGLTMGIFGLIFFFFSETMVRLFTNDPQVVPIAAMVIKIAAIEQPLMALEFVLAGALRGAGDTKWAMYISLIGNWFVRIPFLALVIYILDLGIIAIWVVFVIDWLIRSAIAVVRFKSGKWKEIKV